jgi:hypothetical protein
MGTKWVEYKGKKILYQDYRGIKGQEVMDALELAGRLMMECPTKVLSLSNVEDMAITSEFMARSKELGKQVFDLKTSKSAIIGVKGLKRIFYEAYIRFLNNSNKQMGAFDTEEAAMDWLVS